jgi:tripartite-type tricarboxylate transporter receptor subunit TctC
VARNQSGIARIADEDADVDSFGFKAARTGGEQYLDLQLGMLLQKAGHVAQDASARQPRVECHAKTAARRSAGAHGLALSDFQLGDDPPAADVEAVALVGEPDASGTANQQTHAKRPFERAHGLADRRGRQAECSRRGREALQFRRANKDADAAQVFHEAFDETRKFFTSSVPDRVWLGRLVRPIFLLPSIDPGTAMPNVESPTTRRHLLGLAAATALVALAPSRNARAQAYPVRPVKFILGVAPGSVPDVATRQIADKLAPLLGQAVIVENRPSAGGIVALEALKTSPPDGYTLSFVHVSNMSVAPSLFPRLPYDTTKDFAPVGIFWRGVQLLAVNPELKATSLAELIKLAKASPGRLRYSSPGNGTPTHLGMEQLKHAAGIDIQHIPYKGPASLLSVLSGEVDMLLEGVEPLLPHVRAGRLRSIALGGAQRLAVLPDVPTFEELGQQEIGTIWSGVIAPLGTPPAVIARLNRDLTTAIQSPEIRRAFEPAGRLITPGSPEEMAATIRHEVPRWREVVQHAQIKVE